MVKLKPLDQQVILITGASSGIGLATAREAAKRGARVVLVARNAEALAEAVRDIEAKGGRAIHAVADVGDPDALARAAELAVERFGRIDTWVNNAGSAIYAKLVDTPLDEHQQLFRTNYFGMVNGCQIAADRLSEGGALITVASIGSDIPTPMMGAYAATKHAMKAYVEALRMELHADGKPIAVTLIKPSGIDTPIAQHAVSHGPGAPIVPPPLYAPELVADAILNAATHVRRDITVGGVGRAEVLTGQHFPWLLDLLTPVFEKVLFRPGEAKPPEDNLFESREAGRVHSGDQSGRRFSLYTSAQLHPGVTTTAIIAGLAGGVALWLGRRKA